MTEENAMVRVANEGETQQQIQIDAANLACAGVRLLVFPDEKLLKEWRERIAALA